MEIKVRTAQMSMEIKVQTAQMSMGIKVRMAQMSIGIKIRVACCLTHKKTAAFHDCFFSTCFCFSIFFLPMSDVEIAPCGQVSMHFPHLIHSALFGVR